MEHKYGVTWLDPMCVLYNAKEKKKTYPRKDITTLISSCFLTNLLVLFLHCNSISLSEAFFLNTKATFVPIDFRDECHVQSSRDQSEGGWHTRKQSANQLEA